MADYICSRCKKTLSLFEGVQCVDGKYVHLPIRVVIPEAKVGEDTKPGYPDDNPKTAFGITKPPINLIPPSALIHEAMAFKYGAYESNNGVGYGPFNWRTKRVSASIYVAAGMRHFLDYWDGQEVASDSKASHLGHVRACAAILIDAAEIGMLNDDRPPKGNSEELIERLTIRKKL